MNRCKRTLPLLAALILALGCAHGEAPLSGAAPAAAPAPDRYVIGQADEIEVQVWEEPELSRKSIVRSDGMLSLPLVTDLKAEGLTVAELRDLLTGRYKDFVADPVVSVMVANPASATFFVTGRVNAPGEYPLRKQTTVLQAVAVAGGFTEWAKRDELALIRRGGQWVRIDYEAVVRGDASQNATLQRGDTLVVP